MSTRRAFPVNCDTLGTVELETENWKAERDGGNVVIHYRAQCECGKEHFGSTLPAVEIKIYREVAAQLGKDLIACANASKNEFVVLVSYPQGQGISNFVIVDPPE